jgi:hypothetical protein
LFLASIPIVVGSSITTTTTHQHIHPREVLLVSEMKKKMKKKVEKKEKKEG